MLGKIVVITILFVAVSSEPVKRSLMLPIDISTILSSKAELFDIHIKPESVTAILKVVKSIIGMKISAVTLAVNWVAANSMGIVVGGIIALGVCKITGKCNLNNDQSFSKLCSFITPERLELAQNLLLNAFRTYAEEDLEDADLADEVDFE